METQRKRIFWRIPLVTAFAFALFWGIWSIFGEVPVMTESWAVQLQLPFSISRWWDVLFSPIWWAFIFVLIFSWEKIKIEIDKKEALLLVLLIGLSFGLFLGTIVGLATGPRFGLGVGLVIFLTIGLVINRTVGLVSGQLLGLGVGLATGLRFGMGVGLVIFLGVDLATGLVCGLVIGLKYLTSRKLWTRSGQWLSG